MLAPLPRRAPFMGGLAHHLRTPRAAIDAGARLLRREPLSEGAVSLVDLMQNSVARMAGLIGNVLDLARGRLAGGLALDRNAAHATGVS